MKTQEEITPSGEDKNNVSDKKSEYLDNEETNKKMVSDDFSIDDIANFLQEKYTDADINSDNLKGEAVFQNQPTYYNNSLTPSKDMHKPKTNNIFKKILLSFCYLIVAFIVTSLIYAFLAWFLDSVIINLLIWFNNLNLWLKIFLFLIGITTILSLLFNIALTLNALICGLINILFPVNLFTIIVSHLFAIISSTALTIELWNIVQNWNFWTVIEFIMIAGFIFSMNFMVVPKKIKYGKYY